MQPLMYNVPLYKMIATPVWKSYEAYTDTVMGIAMGLVNKVIIIVIIILFHFSNDAKIINYASSALYFLLLVSNIYKILLH